MTLDQAERARIAQAIRQAETATSGEIVCVIARASSNYIIFPLLWSAIGALALPGALILATEWPALTIFVIQWLTFGALFCLLSMPPLRMALAPRALQRSRAYRAATEQFFARGVSRTKHATGILIFCSLAERYARIIADDGIAARVDAKAWQGAVDLLVADARDGRIAEGCIAAVHACGALLARHCPPDAETGDELPDRVYLI